MKVSEQFKSTIKAYLDNMAAVSYTHLMGLKCWRTCFFRKFLPIVEVTR